MVKFSAEYDAGEGPSSPKRRREETDEGPPSDGGGVENPADEKMVSVRIELDVLDCPICYEPLSAPVYQCQNGHIACSSCCSKLENRCHSCSSNISATRCLAIEKVIESIKIPCSNSIHGCKEALSYPNKYPHEELCVHAPCKCPISDCQFSCSPKNLSLHLSCIHSILNTWFKYNNPFYVSLGIDQSLIILNGDDRTLYLVNRRYEHIGNAVFLTYVEPSSLERLYGYELVIRKGDRSIQQFSFTESISKHHEPSCQTDYLMIPLEYFSSMGRVNLQVRIMR